VLRGRFVNCAKPLRCQRGSHHHARLRCIIHMTVAYAAIASCARSLGHARCRGIMHQTAASCVMPSIIVKEIASHCNENPIYVFLFWELRGLSPNFHIHVSVSDFYISRIGPAISLQQNRQTDQGNIKNPSQTHECENWDLRPHNTFSGNICFEFSVASLQCMQLTDWLLVEVALLLTGLTNIS
jgi:hypothetical protein